MKPEDKIDYYYFNMNTKQFVASARKLLEQGQKGDLKRAIPNYKTGCVLIAQGTKHFTEIEACLSANKQLSS